MEVTRLSQKRGAARIASFVLSAAALLSAGIVHAEGPKFSGFVDTTYNYNLDRPASRITQLRSFDRKTDTFLLNSAQLNVEGSKEGIGYYAEMAWGTDASNYKSAGTVNDAGLPAAPSNNAINLELQEAFITYLCPITHLQLKAGKFVTYAGIEVIESKDNFTISRGHLFGLAEAYTHTGAMIGYAFPKWIDLWVGAVNGWDNYTDNNYGKTFVAKLGINPTDKVAGVVSLLRGAEKNNNTNDARTSVDTTWFLKFIPKTTLALQANAGEEENNSIADRNSDGIADGGAGHWYGFGVQPKVDITDKFFVGARYEWFSDLDGARTGTTQVVQNVTLSPGVNLTENLMFRVEYRHDWSTRMVFERSNGTTDLADTNTIGTEFIYKFN